MARGSGHGPEILLATASPPTRPVPGGDGSLWLPSVGRSDGRKCRQVGDSPLSLQMTRLEIRLAAAAWIVLSADISLWLGVGEPWTPVWFLYGAAACSLALALVGVVVQISRGRRDQILKASRARYGVWRAKVSRGRRVLCDSRHFHERLGEEMRRSRVYRGSLGLVVVRVGEGGVLDPTLEESVRD